MLFEVVLSCFFGVSCAAFRW